MGSFVAPPPGRWCRKMLTRSAVRGRCLRLTIRSATVQTVRAAVCGRVGLAGLLGRDGLGLVGTQPNPNLVSPNPAQPNPTQLNPAQPHPTPPNPTKPNPANQTQLYKTNPTQPNQNQPNRNEPNPTQTQTQPNLNKPKQTRTNPNKPNPNQSEANQTQLNQTQPSKPTTKANPTQPNRTYPIQPNQAQPSPPNQPADGGPNSLDNRGPIVSRKQCPRTTLRVNILRHHRPGGGAKNETALWTQKRGRKTDAQLLGVSFATAFLRPQSGRKKTPVFRIGVGHNAREWNIKK